MVKVEDTAEMAPGAPRQLAAEAPGSDELRHLVHELQTHQLELELQNHELLQAQRTLEQARSRYAELYDSAPVSYVSLDERACIQEINLTGALFLGVDRTQLLGRPFVPFVRKEDVARFFAHVRDCLWLRREVTTEISLRTASGAVIEAQLHSSAFVEGATEEAPARRLCRTAITDISAYRRAQESVSESRERYRALLAGVPDIVARLDEGGSLLDFHAPPGVALPLTREEIVGQRLASVLPPELAAKGEALVRAALETGQPQQIEIKLGAGPAERHYEVRVVRSGSGEVTALCREITELRRMQLSLGRAERMASLGVLAAGVAHEINNPLAFIYVNLEIVLGALRRWSARPPAGVSEPQIHHLEAAARDAHTGATRIRDTVRDLRRFSRSGEDALGPIDVHRVLDLTVSMARNEIAHRAQLRAEYGEVPPVLADESRLGQVFLNLLVNAAHAIPEGTAHRNEIVLRTTAAGGRVVVEVSDTGEGIPPDLLERIFDPFFTTKQVGKGIGLGLAICHSIVTSLGGELTVQSEPGRGSTFRVELPAASREPAPRPAEAGEAAPGRRLRILVVDDEPLVASGLERLLGEEHEALGLTRGDEALARVRAGERWDLILCDVMMPEMTGQRFYEEIGLIDPDLQRKIVFMTGGAFTPTAREFLASVPSPQLEKPIEVEQLGRLLEGLALGAPGGGTQGA